jgi:hypothetical protein
MLSILRCLAQSPKFTAADALVKTNNAATSAHALAETYATLSGDGMCQSNPYGYIHRN